MIRRIAAVLIIATLCTQIFLGFTLNPIASSQITSENSYAISQDYGSRLDPGGYTNHVPFMINGTADFEFLGFPGSGTSEDPYLISGLNISYTDGAPPISILNTDAYFVIVDCFIKANTSDFAITLINTTHGKVEYVTVNAAYAIGCFNTDNMQLQHLLIESLFYCLHIEDSSNCYVYDNNMTTTSLLFLFWAFDCTSLTFEQNLFTQTSSYDVLVGIFRSNYTIARSNQYNQGFGGLGFVECYNITVTEEVIMSDEGGILVRDSNLATIRGCEVTISGNYGIHLENTNESTIADCIISAPGDYGILAEFSRHVNISDCEVSGLCENAISVDTCAYAIVSNNYVTDATFLGIGVVNSYSSVISENTIEDNYIGMFVNYCDFAKITSNHVTGSYYGIYASYSDDVKVAHNYAANCQEVGMGTSNCENFTIADNLIEDIGLAGIGANYEDDGYNGSIYRNTITNASGGIIVNNLNRIRIINNTMSHLFGMIITFGVGIEINYGDFVIIEGNEVDDANYGIVLERSRHSVVESNSVEAALITGIGFTNSQNISVFTNELQHCTVGIALSSEFVLGMTWDTSSHIENNTLNGCGFGFNFDELSDYYRQDITNNTVNDKPFYYGLEQSNLYVQGTSYGQIVLANCTNLNVNSTGYDYGNVMTYVDYSSQIILDGLNCQAPFSAFQIARSQNVTVMNSEIERTDVPAALTWLAQSLPVIYVGNCQNTTILDTIILGNENGVGVNLMDSPSTIVVNCTFLDLYGGIRFRSVPSSILVENLIIDSQYGIYSSPNFYEDQNLTITRNEIYHCSLAGISIINSDTTGSVIQDNIIESCGIGIEVIDSPIRLIKNNTIRWSSDYGISSTDSSISNISYNIIALNGIENGYDNQLQYWDDDSLQIGNWYNDYSGVGVYPISGGAGAQDRYPMKYTVTEPIINSPQDIYYAEDSTGNQITWLPYDDYLSDWQVTINGVVVSAEVWNFENVTVYIDGLEYGTHTVVVTVWDIHDNNVTDTVLVHVYDATLPTIDRPSDRIAFVDATGQVITWEVADLHPENYEVQVNGEIAETGTWFSGELEINIDGYPEGIYEFTLIVYDIDANERNDTVNVEFVDDDEGPSLDSPEDITFNYDEVGAQIVWNPEDEYPSYYEITVNGTLLLTDNWSGSRIVLDLTGLEVGQYDFELTVFDGSGLSASDEVRVNVLRLHEFPTTTAQPLDVSMFVMLGVGVGATAVVIIVVYFIRRKRVG